MFTSFLNLCNLSAYRDKVIEQEAGSEVLLVLIGVVHWLACCIMSWFMAVFLLCLATEVEVFVRASCLKYMFCHLSWKLNKSTQNNNKKNSHKDSSGQF